MTPRTSAIANRVFSATVLALVLPTGTARAQYHSCMPMGTIWRDCSTPNEVDDADVIRPQLIAFNWENASRDDRDPDVVFDELYWEPLGRGPHIGSNWVSTGPWQVSSFRDLQRYEALSDVVIIGNEGIWLDQGFAYPQSMAHDVMMQAVGVLEGGTPEVTTLVDRHRVRWRPIVEGLTSLTACTGGADWGPRGFIVGYVAWSLPLAGYAAPTPVDFLLKGERHLADLSTLDFNVPDLDGLGGSDLDPGDGLHLVNPDGLPDTGDEILDLELCPLGGRAQWYSVQPIVKGRFAYFDGGTQPWWPSVHVDVTGDGVADAADILGDGLIELTDGCIGLGLTWLGGIATSPRPGRGEDLPGAPSCGTVTSCDRGLRTLGIGPPREPSPIDRDPTATPMTIRRPVGPGLVVGWEETLGDGGYELYVGDLRVLANEHRYTHRAMFPCAPVPTQPVTIVMPPGDVYFLVTRVDSTGAESSYGRDSFGRERPTSDWCP